GAGEEAELDRILVGAGGRPACHHDEEEEDGGAAPHDYRKPTMMAASVMASSLSASGTKPMSNGMLNGGSGAGALSYLAVKLKRKSTRSKSLVVSCTLKFRRVSSNELMSPLDAVSLFRLKSASTLARKTVSLVSLAL